MPNDIIHEELMPDAQRIPQLPTLKWIQEFERDLGQAMTEGQRIADAVELLCAAREV